MPDTPPAVIAPCASARTWIDNGVAQERSPRRKGCSDLNSVFCWVCPKGGFAGCHAARALPAASAMLPSAAPNSFSASRHWRIGELRADVALTRRPAIAARLCRLEHHGEASALCCASEEPMPRSVLDESRIHPAIRERVAGHHAAIVHEVQAAMHEHPVLVVGMAQNPFPRRARRMLDAAAVPYRYLSYGNYFGGWRRRNALKMWTGWPTFPMVFVNGTLIGGADELGRLVASGELKRLLDA